MKMVILALVLTCAGCATHVSKSKREQVQTSFNQTTAPIKYGAMQRAAAASH